jgi:fatty-acid desaturase
MNKITLFRPLWLAFNLALPFSLVYGIYNHAWVWLLGMFLMMPIIGGGLGISVAMHRYISHKSFQTTELKHVLLCIAAFLSGQGSPITWTLIHRHHHKYSDQPRDIHSPNRGYIRAGILWAVSPLKYYQDLKVRDIPLRDLMKDKYVKFFEDYYYHLWYALIIVGLLVSWKALVFLILAPVGKGYVDAFITNVITHIKTPGSYRNFETTDNSQNLQWYVFFSLGDGLHNNHHALPNQLHQVVKDGEIDFAGKLAEKFLIEHDVSKVYKF